MAKKSVNNNIYLVAQKSDKKERKLDYYLELPNGKREYAFTRNYSAICYMACKSKVPVNRVLYARKRNEAFMGLVKYLNYIMPYFIEYFGLEVREMEKSRNEI